MTSYSSPLRRNVKWYKKVMFELLLNTALVNSLVLYKKVNGNMQIAEFMGKIALSLLETEDTDREHDGGQRTPKHTLFEVQGPKRSSRRRCKFCYKTLAKSLGRANAQMFVKKVNTKCDKCNLYLLLFGLLQ